MHCSAERPSTRLQLQIFTSGPSTWQWSEIRNLCHEITHLRQGNLSVGRAYSSHKISSEHKYTILYASDTSLMRYEKYGGFRLRYKFHVFFQKRCGICISTTLRYKFHAFFVPTYVMRYKFYVPSGYIRSNSISTPFYAI